MSSRRTGILIVAVFLVGLVTGLLIGGSLSSTLSSSPSTTTTRTLQVTVAGLTTIQIPSLDILSVCFSPGGSCANQVVYWIGRANSSIHILMYSFTLDSIGNALIQAKQRKPNLDIRIVWDESGLEDAGSEYLKLLSAGFQMHVDHRSGLLHDKFAIIDGHIVLTGSFNWTNSANDTNRENLLVLDNPPIASAYEKNFQQNWQTTT